MAIQIEAEGSFCYRQTSHPTPSSSQSHRRRGNDDHRLVGGETDLLGTRNDDDLRYIFKNIHTSFRVLIFATTSRSPLRIQMFLIPWPPKNVSIHTNLVLTLSMETTQMEYCSAWEEHSEMNKSRKWVRLLMFSIEIEYSLGGLISIKRPRETPSPYYHLIVRILLK